jgi:asparagine synthase (glutamine-hydrolysing)
MKQNLLNDLKVKLSEAVRRNKSEGLLLSGGLDSSILALLSPDSKSFTVELESYGSDMRYAKQVSRFVNLMHYQETFSVQKALDTIPEVIKILRSFDPAIPNDISTYIGLNLAKEKGIKTVMTGDGGDELFAGYSYMYQLDLDSYIRRLTRSWTFSSNKLASALGIEVKQPYLDKEFVQFAIQVPHNMKVRKEPGKTWGKWILRQAFEPELPQEIIWRDKTAIEYGSGSTALREIIASTISDTEFSEKKKLYPIKFRSKEHLYYYEVYQKVIGKIPLPKKDEKQCSECGAGVPQNSQHCRVCGGFPIK